MYFYGWSTGVCILSNGQNGHYKGVGSCEGNIKVQAQGMELAMASVKPMND